MSPYEKPTDYVLRLRPISGFGWSTPPVQRLRLALKRLSRTFGFVCTECRPVDATERDRENKKQV